MPLRKASEIAPEHPAILHEGRELFGFTIEELQLAMHEVWQQACTEAVGRCDDYVQAICSKIGTTKAESQAAINCRDRVIALLDSKKPEDF